MKILKSGLFSLALTLAATVLASPPETKSASAPFVVHEWGTFLTMNGSDGVVLDSMYHEEHALPDFVYTIRQDQIIDPGIEMKFETPVIYFYTDQPRKVDVTARFTSGIWTHWYPQAKAVKGVMSRKNELRSEGNDKLKGCLHWQADLIPATQLTDSVLPLTPEGSLWNFARQVDAAYVRTRETEQGNGSKLGKKDTGQGESDYERYLFYRGLGRANLPLDINARNEGTLALSEYRDIVLKHLFVLRVENGRGEFRYLPTLRPGQRLDHVIPDMKGAEPLSLFSTHVGAAVAKRLEESGLYAREAQAMVNTWRSSYFQSEGIRVLYVLPQSWTEGFIPLQITPRPDKLVRVMVGRTELLTSAREQAVSEAVVASNSTDPKQREGALATLHAQGRYIEPILRRLLRVSTEPMVQAGCRRLLKTDWVNAIRPASLTTIDEKH